MRILLDYDGVLGDFCGALEKIVPGFCGRKVLAYDFSKGDYGCERDDIFRAIGRPETFRCEELYPGVGDVLDYLRLRHDCMIYTQVVDIECARVRNEKLRELGVPYEIVTRPGVKEPLLDFDVVVEDSLDVLRGYLGSDVRLFLVDREYNRETHNSGYADVFRGCTRINGVEGLLAYV